jgi:hypothetical protein
MMVPKVALTKFQISKSMRSLPCMRVGLTPEIHILHAPPDHEILY